ncbi:MAG: hypothetical protein K9N34_05515 [Candidatus Marinimicrobia bacterium]|nr:hypothetical protein [Candidatus Neomarinimicrobiota bacterium]MCF7841069.1 hypothetical protein [Candidatus Neomarinimicrobiota bacterium]MCF7902294.1 hypothetical protein [Candidatus Neomarinimicrobiota bacterium]
MANTKNQDILDFLGESSTGLKGANPRGKSPVIKNLRTRPNEQGSVKIPIHHPGSGSNAQQPQVEPILEDGAIVGIQFTCSCHRSTEIRFDYDESSPAPTGNNSTR